MKYENKFNRAFLKSDIKTTDWNAGAFREVSCEFKFTHEGKVESWEIKVVNSNPIMEPFGYGSKRNENIAWKNCYKTSIPEFVNKEKLKEMINKSIQTDEEVEKVLTSYGYAMKEFKEAFCL